MRYVYWVFKVFKQSEWIKSILEKTYSYAANETQTRCLLFCDLGTRIPYDIKYIDIDEYTIIQLKWKFIHTSSLIYKLLYTLSIWWTKYWIYIINRKNYFVVKGTEQLNEMTSICNVIQIAHTDEK